MTTAEKIKREIAEPQLLAERMQMQGLDRKSKGLPPPEIDEPIAWARRHRHMLQRAGGVFFVLMEVLEMRGDIAAELRKIEATLLKKNAAYGDSALDPVRVFSDAPADAALRVRIDDKLSRLMRGSDAGEDTLGDLAGYLVLLLVSMRGGE